MISSVYIHIPFCLSRCHYCNFYTLGGHCFVSDEYIIALKREIQKYTLTYCPTVYFGGGTPSLLSAKQVKEILALLPIDENTEITLEANPETLTLKKLEDFYKVGINRLSLGVQTVLDSSLKTLGRVHTNDSVKSTLDNAKKIGFKNISCDIMIALPNYTNKELKDTLDFFIENDVKHISCYMLKIEEGTEFYNTDFENLPSEDESADFYLYATDYLEKAGYIQYEISNYSKPNFESRHNKSYWQLKNYIGFGPSAHSCINGKRHYYKNDLTQFINNATIIEDEAVTASDYIMLSLRLKTGLSFTHLLNEYNITIPTSTIQKLKALQKEGYCILTSDNLSLTAKGFLVQNTIINLILD